VKPEHRLKRTTISVLAGAVPFRTAVSLHSHTLHSRETLAFIYRLAQTVPAIRTALAHGEARYASKQGKKLDLKRAWWTPPLTAYEAWQLEKRQIERMGAQALVSLTDHDEMAAPLSLRVMDGCRDFPVSTEWTVPYGNTFFHIGVHNIPAAQAQQFMFRMESITRSQSRETLADVLHDLDRCREALIVFNHPYWDESVIGREWHRTLASQFSTRYRGLIHAFEINGLRPWDENRSVLALAHAEGKPAISGGDRHALEPNTVLNLTNAATFAEFAAEIRSGISEVLITPQYLEPLVIRVLQAMEEILAERESHGLGWRRWSDRAFYECDDGKVRSLTSLFADRTPLAVRIFTGGVALYRRLSLRNVLRSAFFPKRQEIAF
jgi:hypothetical protein